MGEVEETSTEIVEEALETDEAVDEVRQEGLEHIMVRHMKASKAWLFASILITLFIALIAAVVTNSNLALAVLGFSPTLIAAIVFIGLLEGDFKDVLFWFTPLGLCFAFLGIGSVANATYGSQLDIPVLTGVNLGLSYVILGIMTAIEYRNEGEEAVLSEEFTPGQLDQYIHTIEDKCKALNFVIGRTYRASNGGTRGMRDKIKVPSDWYNEFNSIKPEEAKEQQVLALDLLGRIQERLHSLLKPEKDVFTKTEYKGLRTLMRDDEGKDRVIDVLSVNDNDPVEDYYLGAMDFCKRVTQELQKL
ncbi:APC family permease [Candidatus Woesearchaeota archaeon]|nr:APC family permease [Candidatus Woesearchaeota archaeon]